MEPLRLSFLHSAGRKSPVDVVRLADLRRRQLDHSMYSSTRPSFHMLHFIVEGSGAHWLDFERIEVRAGDVMHIRAEQVHAFDSESTHDALLLMFTPGSLQQLPGVYPARWPASQVLRPRERDFGVLRALVEAQASLDHDGFDMRSEAVGPHLLAAVLMGLSNVVGARLGGLDPTADRYAALVDRFETLAREHAVGHRAVNWYIERLDTTAKTLGRALREVRDSSPKELLDRHVMVEAKRRLGTTTRTVEAIGLELGFPEATNFVRFFKRLAGVPPESFRRRLRESESGNDH